MPSDDNASDKQGMHDDEREGSYFDKEVFQIYLTQRLGPDRQIFILSTIVIGLLIALATEPEGIFHSSARIDRIAWWVSFSCWLSALIAVIVNFILNTSHLKSLSFNGRERSAYICKWMRFVSGLEFLLTAIGLLCSVSYIYFRVRIRSGLDVQSAGLSIIGF